MPDSPERSDLAPLIELLRSALVLSDQLEHPLCSVQISSILDHLEAGDEPSD